MPEMSGDQPVTRAILRADLQAFEGRVIEAIENAIAHSRAEIVKCMQELVLDSQNEITRGFEAFSSGHNFRFRKLRADFSNVDDLPLAPPEQ